MFHVERPGEIRSVLREPVPRGTISSLDLGTPTGQDRRRAAAFRRSYLMRIRRRDRDPAETRGSEEPAVVPYDYDQDHVHQAEPVTTLGTGPSVATPESSPPPDHERPEFEAVSEPAP